METVKREEERVDKLDNPREKVCEREKKSPLKAKTLSE
jgi:hypothetical protein